MTTSIKFEKTQVVLCELLKECESVLCSEAIEEVRHYIDNGEPEIAFEGLFIELMKINTIPEGLAKEDCMKFGKYLNLDVDSVLDDKFWPKFVSFIK
jgi:hypothetical protein